jgi:hypothetical protein
LSDGAPPHFAVPMRRAMRREGLAGSKVEVRLQGDTLVLTGDAGGSLSVSAAEVDRIRIASVRLPPPRRSPRPPRTLYETRIWRSGNRARLLIGPPADRRGHYRAVMREFAGWVFEDGGKVLRGPGLATLLLQTVWATVPLGLIGLLLLGGAIVEGRPWLWLLAFFVLTLPVLLARRAYRRHWPRRVTRPEELDEVLPPTEESQA